MSNENGNGNYVKYLEMQQQGAMADANQDGNQQKEQQETLLEDYSQRQQILKNEMIYGPGQDKNEWTGCALCYTAIVTITCLVILYILIKSI